MAGGGAEAGEGPGDDRLDDTDVSQVLLFVQQRLSLVFFSLSQETFVNPEPCFHFFLILYIKDVSHEQQMKCLCFIAFL